MITEHQPQALQRRSFLGLGALLLAAVALPLRAFAAMVRPAAAFTATTRDAVFAELGGVPASSDQIIVDSPEIAADGAAVKVGVTSNIPGTTKIMVMVEMNPNPLAAMFSIPEGTLPSIETKVKVAQTCLIYGVVEADGKTYMAAKETKVTLGGCGG